MHTATAPTIQILFDTWHATIAAGFSTYCYWTTESVKAALNRYK